MLRWYNMSNKYLDNLAKEVLQHYGGRCQCCGFSDLDLKVHGKRFLKIDHIWGNGYKHFKELRGRNFYRWLKINHYPTGFRVLCAGCNAAMIPGHIHCVLHGGMDVV